MWVVKLGGSLVNSAFLTRWLRALVDAGRGKAVIVPGGGPFAETVRQAQGRWNFDDAAAHAMAVLAMDQYAYMLAALGEGISLAIDRPAIERILLGGGLAVWVPSRMVLAEPSIARSWDITSDSLAAWLAGQFAGARLVLIKAITVAEDTSSLARLERSGIVDSGFRDYLPAVDGGTFILGGNETDALELMFRDDVPRGVRVTDFRS